MMHYQTIILVHAAFKDAEEAWILVKLGGNVCSEMAAILNAITLQTACSNQWDKNSSASWTQQ